MSLFDRLFGEFVDVIDWIDDSRDTMVWRFPRHGNEIKFGAKLTVREGQTAVFVNEGQVADVLGPGMYELDTQNLPLLSTLQAWPHGFESPFKAEVYFCNTRRFTDLKWGTRNPLMMRDAEFGPVRLRAFGTYTVRVAEPSRFLREIVGTDGVFSVDEISDQLRNLIASGFASVIASSGIPALDLAAHYPELGGYLSESLEGMFEEYGLEVPHLTVENISLPSAVEVALDKRTSMGVVGDLGRYFDFQSASALEAAAENPGGAAGAGVGIGAGIAMGRQLVGHGPAAVPPPVPRVAFHVARAGQATGPFTLDTLRAMAEVGELDASTLVWCDGMPAWQAASDVPTVSDLVASSSPPPLPQ
ncbi:MAG: SPFH domain-containing protein [Pseudomonadota bacterium]